MKPLLLILIFANFLKGEAQTISFSKLMTYYISQDEQLILNDLRAKKYIIEKERKADTKFFDTEIDCYKSTDGQYTSLTGIFILKTAGMLTALNYFTLNKADFNKKLQEVRVRGFDLITEDTTTQWVYQKNDTIVVVEKRIIKASNRSFLRYEIGVALRSREELPESKDKNINPLYSPILQRRLSLLSLYVF